MSNKTLYKHRISTCNLRNVFKQGQDKKNIKLPVKPVVLHLNRIYFTKLCIQANCLVTLNFP